ncbi:hypothetical protein PC116_g22015 [Phytophthora cactorum]|uniref:Uncharacterized protein n=1 Tax=Phytophthora cactorum TaxID=29920 RepID=A0A8T1K1J2_9STRA|nr:hypothetical protein Pcac1_g4238 [Phytophthora cactorum]KAG2886955.1 hypothetical protein PC114_g19019 [Phytophthora cactorum]KAG2911259.1 hypothetical protein PC117_g19218 [Phytophthora cactorum]KAG2982000.1 hypothetical protein PC119_g20913 [Phytophthora cactorum]KAG3005576.1 hypothetical protein PC120_g17882 [Phytophthora cactorum]
MEWRFSSGVGLTTIATRYIHHRQGGLSVSANDGVVALKLVQLPGMLPASNGGLATRCQRHKDLSSPGSRRHSRIPFPL